MVIIEPSILSANYAVLGEQAQEAEAAGAKALQIDVMDGHFVPNLTFGPGIVQALRPLVNVKLDIHLMVEEPDWVLPTFVAAGADRIIVHAEACKHLYRTLELIRSLNVEAGVALNPATSIAMIEEVLDMVDLVQVMTVNPGFGGQNFLFSQIRKIERLRQMIRSRGLHTLIAVDGGIDITTTPIVVEAGATVLVAGSSIYNQNATVSENIQKIHRSISQ
ncbi:MAG: ribulose-phosphate 3-epimerase [Anaerolineales bacterium]|nr:ribulose-phosphate 3-epimerase [Anaerolineales bacterium]